MRLVAGDSKNKQKMKDISHILAPMHEKLVKDTTIYVVI